ncbi:tRNA-splicing ligase RtcB [Larkinella arboricola]|uniref:3'-phosphate/5'-hydroxy nucleic acid ligase n=1 Tax=Larkinella arboricola TaxID=643671 RepID=A0A327X3G3_LARAB|nr:RtcB family protein [Larkinella arboricola]RAJ97498.1 tRNA-splicing ligase RtcB [Larkinella arboricola]
MKLKLTGKDLRKIGYPEGKVISIAISVMQHSFKHTSHKEALELLEKVRQNPTKYLKNETLGTIAAELIEKPAPKPADEIPLSEERKEYTVFGADHIEAGAINQMEIAMRLPVTVAGALMPDAHQGYGLPIGGVLAAHNAIIPYGVGVDIGCRMCLSIYDLPENTVYGETKKLKNILQRETLFGAGREFSKPMDDEVLDRPEFRQIPLLRGLHDKAVRQIGSSGSGNHFVEFGIAEITDPDNEFGVPAGTYLALLSHSGSRGLGASIANHFTRVAMEKTPLPSQAKHLAWLSLESEAGQEYWLSMNLAGDYASACHHQIHHKIARALGQKPLAMVENHHNFAWKERHAGPGAEPQELIVHRKGATPAGKGVLGIIPGSMTQPGFIVRGRGEAASLDSASHGAGRRLSRTAAKNSLTWSQVQDMLNQNGITLLGGGLDEAPMAYKDINQVMSFQRDLVDVVGRFQPKIVRMDD